MIFSCKIMSSLSLGVGICLWKADYVHDLLLQASCSEYHQCSIGLCLWWLHMHILQEILSSVTFWNFCLICLTLLVIFYGGSFLDKCSILLQVEAKSVDNLPADSILQFLHSAGLPAMVFSQLTKYQPICIYEFFLSSLLPVLYSWQSCFGLFVMFETLLSLWNCV